MSVDFKKLSSFVKIVDTGSMSRAANTLRIAQPALSQQVAALEAHFKQKLLLRSNHGVVPTEAGFTLYRHAQAMLKQLEQSQRDVTQATRSLQGHVSIGLATFSGAANFAGPLLLALADKHPDVVLNVSDSFGHVLSELVISGRLDMALIYSFGAIKGTRLQPLFREEFSEVTLDGYDSEVTLKCNVKVEPGAIHVDYAGTSAQVLHAINVRKHYRYAHTVYALKCLLDPETPNNEGCMLPITDEAPVGSILNPRNTAAGNLRNLIGHVIPSLIFRALEGVVPDKVQGDSGGAPIWGVNCQGQNELGEQYGAAQNLHGGQGGRSTADGIDTLSFPSNCRITPAEMYELAVPALIECKELIPDSGGPGQFRGGLGQRLVFRNISSGQMNIYLASEHVKNPCFGVVGGKDGRPGHVLKNGEPVFAKGHIPLEPGARLTVELPGGGGWGDPAHRSHELIAEDLRLGLVTSECAKADYGYAAE